ncbi:MAG TPA: FAD-dependent oxidoreductase, partial [Clostridia bacterium]|nr:FAD-dependent oxidoreductase [Clostridia bacterium]
LKEGNQLIGAVFASPEGMFAIRCTVLIDATGDAFAATLAGAPVCKGREEDGLMQPVSIMFTIGGVDDGRAITGENQTYDVRTPSAADAFRKECADASTAGLLPRAAAFVRLYRATRPGECRVNTTHANFIDATKVEDLHRAELDLRDQIPHIIDFLQLNVKGFEQCYLMDSADTLGVRETRRILGEYVLTEQDIRNSTVFDDVVVHDANFILDVHGMRQGGQDVSEKVKDYDIPYRCLIPREVDGLLAVGRCISGTHLASSSYRVMSIAMALGQAGGIAGALSVQKKVQPRELNPRDVQVALEQAGVVLRGNSYIGMK